MFLWHGLWTWYFHIFLDIVSGRYFRVLDFGPLDLSFLGVNLSILKFYSEFWIWFFFLDIHSLWPRFSDFGFWTMNFFGFHLSPKAIINVTAQSSPPYNLSKNVRKFFDVIKIDHWIKDDNFCDLQPLVRCLTLVEMSNNNNTFGIIIPMTHGLL